MSASVSRIAAILRLPISVPVVLALALGAACGLLVTQQIQASGIAVSQKGRMFHPDNLSVARGEVVTFVNDDSDLLHHVFVESDTFNFDSGDQNPGTKTRIVFPAAGDFRVLCGIHPKMKLDVRVR